MLTAIKVLHQVCSCSCKSSRSNFQKVVIWTRLYLCVFVFNLMRLLWSTELCLNLFNLGTVRKSQYNFNHLKGHYQQQNVRKCPNSSLLFFCSRRGELLSLKLLFDGMASSGLCYQRSSSCPEYPVLCAVLPVPYLCSWRSECCNWKDIPLNKQSKTWVMW